MRQCLPHGGDGGGDDSGDGGAPLSSSTETSRVSNDAASLKVSCLFMTAVFYVVIQAHSRLWGSILSLQGFKLLFRRRISSQPTARKKQFLRAVGFVFSTDRTQFSDCTQKLTRRI